MVMKKWMFVNRHSWSQIWKKNTTRVKTTVGVLGLDGGEGMRGFLHVTEFPLHS